MIVEQITTYSKRERIEPKGDRGYLPPFFVQLKPNQGGT